VTARNGGIFSNLWPEAAQAPLGVLHSSHRGSPYGDGGDAGKIRWAARSPSFYSDVDGFNARPTPSRRLPTTRILTFGRGFDRRENSHELARERHRLASSSRVEPPELSSCSSGFVLFARGRRLTLCEQPRLSRDLRLL